MIINKNFEQTIKIKDLAYLNDLACEVVEYYPKNNLLIGRVYITGAYHSSKTDEVKLISEDIEFSFEFEKDDFYIEDIECIRFDYSVLEGVGLKVNFEIKLEVDVTEELDIREDIDVNYEEKIEAIKEEVTNIVDEKLSEKLEIIEDNFPQNDVVFRNIKDETNTLKIIYFNEEKELSDIAKQNNISLDSLFKNNKHTDFNKRKRVIINHGK